ncbi:hypothetical protein [Psychroflexus lacisalsi]|jgi:hypothetical protein|uniref:Cardiolipin synthase N-terminal domain-containing protein n=1 Tax=Psychroflexus lacisalsi TaxID=503928 RepID=A0ABN1KCV9_9FLAO|nr:hypothetical protein [Psychroflexus lacisalsi]MBZ9620044.1 hypothetical protein [Psychroflexus lacisalsi]
MELILPEPLIHIFLISLFVIKIITSIHVLVVKKRLMERVLFISMIWIFPMLGIVGYYAFAYVFHKEEKRKPLLVDTFQD